MEDEDMLIPLKLNGLTKNKKEEMRECNSVQRPSAYASAFAISFVTSIVFSLVKSPQELHALVYAWRSASERSISQTGRRGSKYMDLRCEGRCSARHVRVPQSLDKYVSEKFRLNVFHPHIKTWFK